ncbi:MAG: response regulator [Thermodesulfobacteriota bacterium]|nr:response regulator [Thermodesulfobacteriota bacterium]
MEREKRVLIVESDIKLAEKIYFVFRKKGLVANTTSRASEAIRSIQQEHISVLILDVDVKDMAWDEVVPIIKGLDPSLPIIITAAHNTPELEAHILRQKVFYYHLKSFGTEELILAVQNAIEKPKSYG